MKLSRLKQMMDQYHPRFHADSEVVIRIKLPYSTAGAQPTVAVSSAHMGFDWDNGKFIITPEEELTPSDRDFAEQMAKLQERVGWIDYENRNLKAEIKRLQKKIKDDADGNYSNIVSDGGMDPRKNIGERKEVCQCETCMPNDVLHGPMRFIVCSKCGNKRCPHATNHIHECTNSNAPGQVGSSWENYK